MRVEECRMWRARILYTRISGVIYYLQVASRTSISPDFPRVSQSGVTHCGDNEIPGQSYLSSMSKIHLWYGQLHYSCPPSIFQVTADSVLAYGIESRHATK